MTDHLAFALGCRHGSLGLPGYVQQNGKWKNVAAAGRVREQAGVSGQMQAGVSGQMRQGLVAQRNTLGGSRWNVATETLLE